MVEFQTSRLGLMEECDLQSQLDAVSEHYQGTVYHFNAECILLCLYTADMKTGWFIMYVWETWWMGILSLSALLWCESPQTSNLALLMAQAFHWTCLAFSYVNFYFMKWILHNGRRHLTTLHHITTRKPFYYDTVFHLFSNKNIKMCFLTTPQYFIAYHFIHILLFTINFQVFNWFVLY